MAHAIDVQFGSCPVTKMSGNVNPKSNIAVGRRRDANKDEQSGLSISYILYAVWLPTYHGFRLD